MYRRHGAAVLIRTAGSNICVDGLRGIDTYDFSQVRQCQPAVHGIDTHCPLANPRRSGLVQSPPHQRAGFRFLMRSYTVFEVVGNAVSCQGARLVDEALG